MTNLQDSTPATDPAASGTTTADTDNSQVQAESTSQETPTQETTGTDGQSEETFFDPNTVPEELKPAYKQMQAAFTKKTQEIAQARKESETLKSKAEAYTRYEKYVPILEEMLGANQQTATQESPEMVLIEKKLRESGYSDEAIDLAKLTGNMLLDIFSKRQEATSQSQRLEQGLEKASQLDPRLNDKSIVYQMEGGEMVTFGDIVARYAATDPSAKTDPVIATQKAIKIVDTLIGKAKLEGKEELSASARGKAAKFPSVTSSPQSAASTNSAPTIREAAEEAKRELGI